MNNINKLYLNLKLEINKIILIVYFINELGLSKNTLYMTILKVHIVHNYNHVSHTYLMFIIYAEIKKYSFVLIKILKELNFRGIPYNMDLLLKFVYEINYSYNVDNCVAEMLFVQFVKYQKNISDTFS